MTPDTKTYVVGIDLGGTKILAAVVDADGNILSRSKLKSVPLDAKKPGPDLIADRMAEATRAAVALAGLELAQIGCVGGSAPGPVDVDRGIVHRAVNLPRWSGPYALGPELAQRLGGLPVVIDNDVNVGTLGEAAYGAGRGIDDVLGIFVGTGIGGGVILDGRLRRGTRWAAGEIGHMILGCDAKKGDVESYASRGAISRRLRKALKKGKAPELKRILEARGNDRITSGVIRKALRANDKTTVRAIRDAQEVLGILIASVVNLLDPECVVMGGGLVESLGEDFLGPMRQIAYDNFFLQQDRERVRIVPAALGDDAGVLGAAVLARTHGA